jgi:hypothetical protein
MALNIKSLPKTVTKEILLPSGGYPYQGSIPGGRIIIKAFDWEAERLLFKGIESKGTREMLKYLEVIKRVCTLPTGFNVGSLLEGDVQYILLESRSLSYGPSYSFDSVCPECNKSENIVLDIPGQLSHNRYPSDFPGTVKVTTSDNDVVDIQFLSADDDIACENTTRQRISKRVVPQDSYEDDYALMRICKHIHALNGGTPDSIEEVRKWVSSLSVSIRSEITAFINKVTPGVSYSIDIVCPHCSHQYSRMLPISADFFRARTVPNAELLPTGVRIGVFGADERSEISPSSREGVSTSNTDSVQGGRIQGHEKLQQVLNTPKKK